LAKNKCLLIERALSSHKALVLPLWQVALGDNMSLQHNGPITKKAMTAPRAAQGDTMIHNTHHLGAWLRLSLTPGVGHESARRLLAAFGEPQAIFAQTEAALGQVVNANQVRALVQMPEGCAALTQQTVEWLQANASLGLSLIHI
jgi:hypothetical protein